MQVFDTEYDARTVQIKEDAYTQSTTVLTIEDINNLLNNKVLYNNFDGHAIILILKKD